jgi:hypothetical protein
MASLQCSQCTRPAFWAVGESTENAHPLCLSCLAVFEQIQTVKFLKSAAMMNNAAEQMDYIAPFGPIYKPIPVAEIARAMTKSSTFNNINISNSKVGVVNTGDLARINATIEITKGKPTEEFGSKLKALIEAIANAPEGDEATKKALTELTKTIADQVLVERSPSSTVIETLFERLVSMSTGLTTILGAAEQLRSAWQHLAG